MESKYKNESIYKSIGEAAKELDLIDKKTGQLQTHTIRYWETQFKQIKPSIRAGRRRYYSKKDIKIINYIKFLLKEKGLTINGVKKILNDKDMHSIDDSSNLGVVKKLEMVNISIKAAAQIMVRDQALVLSPYLFSKNPAKITKRP